MEVILKEDIRALGKAGEVVKVRSGFARNYLLPKGLAVQADTGNLKELEHHKKAVQTKLGKLKKGAEELAARITPLHLSISKGVGEENKLFGSVTTKDIAEALRKEKITVEKRQIHLDAPIKQLGDYEIPVKLHPEVTATLKVAVVKG